MKTTLIVLILMCFVGCTKQSICEFEAGPSASNNWCGKGPPQPSPTPEKKP